MKFIQKNLPTLFSLLLSLMTSNSLVFTQERILKQEDNLDESDDAMSTTPSSVDVDPEFFSAFCQWPHCNEEFTAKPLYKKHCQEHFYKAYKAVHKNSRFRCPLKINGDQKQCREILSKDTFSTHCKKKHDFHLGRLTLRMKG